MAHLSEGEVVAFAAGELDPAAWHKVVRHLLTGCTPCRERLGGSAPFLFFEETPPSLVETSDGVYEEALDRALAAARQFGKRWAQQRDLAAEVLPFLTKDPARGLRAVPRQTRESAFGWPLAEALLQASFEERFRDPKRMVTLAHQASSVANGTPEGDYPPGLVSDLRARAAAELANAYRVQERFGKAEEALASAYEHYEDGTQEQALLALMLEVEASLRRAQRRIPETLAILSRACDLYLEIGERHLAGRTMVSKGLAFYTNREAAKAVQCLEQGLSLVDRIQDPQVVTTAYQSLVGALVDCREFRRAGELLLESGLRQAFAAEPLNLLRLRWVEGQIHAGLGRLAKAEHAFQEVREGFRDHDLEYDAALAGLDLAAVWLRQGDIRKVHQLASQMLMTFRVVGVQAEAFKAMRLLETSCEERAVTLSIVQGIRVFLDRLQFEPHLTLEEALVI
jgi:tetratricopeptide (TPR) repeat protein